MWLTKSIKEAKRNKNRAYAFSDSRYAISLSQGEVGRLLPLPDEILNKLTKLQRHTYDVMYNHKQLMSTDKSADILYKYLDDDVVTAYPYYYATTSNLSANDNPQREGLNVLSQNLENAYLLLKDRMNSFEKALSIQLDEKEKMRVLLSKLIAITDANNLYEAHEKLDDFKLTADDFFNEDVPKWDIENGHNTIKMKNYIPKSYQYVYDLYVRQSQWLLQIVKTYNLLNDLVFIVDYNAHFKAPDMMSYFDAILIGPFQGNLAVLNNELGDKALLDDMLKFDPTLAPELNKHAVHTLNDIDLDSINLMSRDILNSLHDINDALEIVLRSILDVATFHRGQLIKVALENDGLTEFVDANDRVNYYRELSVLNKAHQENDDSDFYSDDGTDFSTITIKQVEDK